MTQLPKPCPFCGKLATLVDSPIPGVRCSCTVGYMPLDEWNTRPIEDALLATCKATLTTFESWRGGNVFPEEIVALRIAIARAEGEAP